MQKRPNPGKSKIEALFRNTHEALEGIDEEILRMAANLFGLPLRRPRIARGLVDEAVDDEEPDQLDEQAVVRDLQWLRNLGRALNYAYGDEVLYQLDEQHFALALRWLRKAGRVVNEAADEKSEKEREHHLGLALRWLVKARRVLDEARERDLADEELVVDDEELDKLDEQTEQIFKHHLGLALQWLVKARRVLDEAAAEKAEKEAAIPAVAVD